MPCTSPPHSPSPSHPSSLVAAYSATVPPRSAGVGPGRDTCDGAGAPGSSCRADNGPPRPPPLTFPLASHQRAAAPAASAPKKSCSPPPSRSLAHSAYSFHSSGSCNYLSVIPSRTGGPPLAPGHSLFFLTYQSSPPKRFTTGR